MIRIADIEIGSIDRRDNSVAVPSALTVGGLHGRHQMSTLPSVPQLREIEADIPQASRLSMPQLAISRRLCRQLGFTRLSSRLGVVIS